MCHPKSVGVRIIIYKKYVCDLNFTARNVWLSLKQGSALRPSPGALRDLKAPGLEAGLCASQAVWLRGSNAHTTAPVPADGTLTLSVPA